MRSANRSNTPTKPGPPSPAARPKGLERGILFLALSSARAADYECAATCPVVSVASNRTNVLIVGDAIAESYFPHLEDLLDGEQSSDACRLSERVEHRGVLARPTLARLGNASDICGTSAGILAGGCVAALVSTLPANASVIYFSWGLDDVCASCFGHRPSLDDYKNNLEAIYATLRTVLAPNGSMIFATTTPAPPSDARRSNDDVVALNAAARELFGPGGAHPEVLVDDLYAAIVEFCVSDPATTCYPNTCDCPAMQNAGSVFSAAGRRYLAIHAAAEIAPTLPGLLAEGLRTPTDEANVHGLPTWKFVLFAQILLLSAVAVFATVALVALECYRRRRATGARPVALDSPRSPFALGLPWRGGPSSPRRGLELTGRPWLALATRSASSGDEFGDEAEDDRAVTTPFC